MEFVLEGQDEDKFGLAGVGGVSLGDDSDSIQFSVHNHILGNGMSSNQKRTNIERVSHGDYTYRPPIDSEISVNWVGDSIPGSEVNRLEYKGPITTLATADLRYDFFIDVGITNQHSSRIYSMPRVPRSKSNFIYATYPAKKRAKVSIQNLNRGYGAFISTAMNFKMKDSSNNFNYELLNTE